MNNEQKKYPTHRLVFSSQNVDPHGAVNQSPPMEVGAAWDRKGGKQGGTLSWAISAETLGQGEYHLRENRQPGQAFDANAPAKTYMISYSEKQAGQSGNSKLGRPVEVASVDESGKVNWLIEPERLNNGAFFVLENQRVQTQGADKHADAFAKIDAKKQTRSNGLER